MRSGRLSSAPDGAEAVRTADAVFIAVGTPSRRGKLLMRQPVIVDLRKVYRPDDMRARGFRYASIGRA